MGSNLLSLPNSSSTSSTSRRKYDVFLSFRGEDTRYKFTDHLYTDLVKRGIVTFRDDENLERGKIISPELLQAIEDSRFAIVILSENYATSSWCLDELAKIIECEKELGMTVLPVFHYVDPSDVRKQTGTFEEAFVAHEKRFEEKRVKTWRDALTLVGNLAGCHLKNISPETEDIQRIVRQISRTVRYKFSELTKDLVGIYPQAMELESLLALDQFDDVQFIGVWAMGGMGKTTLAQFVYDKVFEEFKDSCFIYDVGGVLEKRGLRDLQKTVILKLLNESNLDCYDDHDLSIKIMTRLRYKRILLVLDGVDGLNQLKWLAGEHDWFGRGSRIIITTRDKRLLKAHSVAKIYEVKPLGYIDAPHLFCLKAFKEEYIPDEYSELSREFLYFVDGLPLALEVLGLFLFGKSIHEWEYALERLKRDPVRDVNKVLQISFDGLGHSEKEIFLHIACLFNHEKKDYVVEILHSLDLCPEIGLSELIDKSLLKISDNNEMWMHNLLREMGRNKVHQESPNEPGKRSRLWLYEDIDCVLKNNTGTEVVQAIDIRGAQKIGICHEEKEECWRLRGLAPLDRLRGRVERTLSWQGFKSSKKQEGPLWNPNAFLKMPNLKFLRVQNIYLECAPTHLPHNLRFIEWSDYPSKSLPCFQPDKLVQLHLQRSKIEILWKGTKIFDKLQFINLADSSNLIISPDFTRVPNLKKLVLAGCSNLHKLHPSIGNLKKLILLDLERCEELSHLVDFTGAPNLEKLVLSKCSNLRRLHPSIGNLKKLIYLDLEYCKELSRLPDKFEMESLQILSLSHCSKVKRIPEFVGMKCIHLLILECLAITELPSSVECLTGLKRLTLSGCKNLQCLPNTICSLTLLNYLDLCGCSKFVNLPENLGNLKGLQEFDLEGTAIEELPSSVGCLTALMSLNLKDCKNLVGLPSTICSLERVSFLSLSGCSKIENLPENLGNMERLSSLRLRGTAIRELPSSTILLKRLHGACFSGCQWPSSSSAPMPTSQYLVGVLLRSLPCLLIKDLDCSDCNLSAFPNDIGCLSFLNALRLSGNDFISLPESISQLSRLRQLYLDGCKRLRSLPNLPSKVEYVTLNNCISLETLPELQIYHFRPDFFYHFYLSCLNCFNLVDNFQSGRNTHQGQSGKLLGRLPCTIPGSEIPTWFKEVNICEELRSVVIFDSFRICLSYPPSKNRIFKIKKVNIQVPFDTCNEWIGIVLCVVFVPSKRCQYPFQIEVDSIKVDSIGRERPKHNASFGSSIWEKYGKLESHHLWFVYLCHVHFNMRTPCSSIDEKGFHEVEIKIATQSLEVEKIGVHLLYKQDIEDPDETMAQDSSDSSGEQGEQCYCNWSL